MADLSLEFNPELIGTPAYGDLKQVGGDLVLTNDANPQGTDATLQSICQRLRLFLGEWFLDTSAGMPWMSQILVKGSQQAHIDGLIKDCILGTPGVMSMSMYASILNRPERSFHVTFTVQTVTSGRMTASVPIIVGAPSP